jgi:hypothetical protein
MIRNAAMAVYLAIVLFLVLFALCYRVDAGIYPYCGQAFLTWGCTVPRETPSLYFDIHHEYVYKIIQIDYNPFSDVCTIFPAWIKVNDPGK